MADQPHRTPRPSQAPHTDQASNGESVPSNAETAESLHDQAERHPGSDATESARHADGRRADDPIGMHDDRQRERPTGNTGRGN